MGQFEMPLMSRQGSIPGSYVTQEQGGLCRQGGDSSEEMPIFSDPPLNNFNKLLYSFILRPMSLCFAGAFPVSPPQGPFLFQNFINHSSIPGLPPDLSSFSLQMRGGNYKTKPPPASDNIILIAY